MNSHQVAHVRLTNIGLATASGNSPDTAANLIIADGNTVRETGRAVTGVRPGISIGLARQLAPEAIVRQFDREAAIDLAAAAWTAARAHTSRIEPTDCDEAFLAWEHSSDGTGAHRLFTTINELTGIEPILALADNRLLARIASGPAGAIFRDKSGLTVLPGGHRQEQWFNRLSVQELWPLPARLRQQLVCMELRTIGAIRPLPPGQLVQMFGPHGSALAQYCQGRDGRTVADGYPGPELSWRMAFDGPVNDETALKSACSRAARHLAEQLEQRMMGCRELILELELEQGQWQGSRRWESPVSDERTISGNLERLWAKAVIQGEMTGAPTAVQVTALGLEAPVLQQAALFADRRAAVVDIDRRIGRRYREQVVATGWTDTRRERMLALFDPVRGAGGGGPA